MKLESYVLGGWHAAAADGAALRDAATGEVIAYAGAASVEPRAVLEFARGVGGPALRELTFRERAQLLKDLGRHLLERKEELYELSYCTGATRADSWSDIEGGITTMLSLASRALKEMPDGKVFVEGEVERLSRAGSFLGQHICVPLEGAAVLINAFNFPVWGMLEKLAPAFIAGMPAIVKPATTTCYLAERLVRRIVESALLPQGALQLICGDVGDLLEHLGCEDVVAFTGSVVTAQQLKRLPAFAQRAARFIAETDSLNASILGPDAHPGTAEFDLYIEEVGREMTAKAGQKCTAIRRAIVPQALAQEATAALARRLASVQVGDPRAAGVTMGPLASLAQRREVLARVAALASEASLACGSPEECRPLGADRERGAFVPPLLLRCRDSDRARAVHEIEAFGPVATLIGYAGVPQAIELARRGGGSLAASVFTADEAVATQLVLGLAPYHGRVLIANRQCAKESTGHGAPLAPLVHGGPGRAGGGEELGGLRSVLHYMQRTALQGSPDALAAISGRWVRGARLRDPGVHPFRKPFHALAIGDTLVSGERAVTVEDIEQFAALTGDRFYAHMDEREAARNPFFGGRVAHGYFLIAAAAGLFVDPAYGPVLGNYGLEHLRFVKPVKPGDRIRVRVTCKAKSARAGKGWGEVTWAAEITNQSDETVASYDVLTMVSEEALPEGTVRSARAG
ncbi:MAG TPA: phenylacetic acid degradation bifunctional protein PaaZ [Steroidobacteraceae bacterium]|nr:phenylacetic acid degradation bifunctional protein PaaZ [Steroidobacteraceae bacterium]